MWMLRRYIETLRSDHSQITAESELEDLWAVSPWRNGNLHLGVSENRHVPRKTQWFSWSLSLWKMAIIGNIPYFQTNPFVKNYQRLIIATLAPQGADVHPKPVVVNLVLATFRIHSMMEWRWLSNDLTGMHTHWLLHDLNDLIST